MSLPTEPSTSASAALDATSPGPVNLKETQALRAPSPPPPVAGAKRDLLGRAAHALQNGKLPKLHENDHAKPLELNYPPVHRVEVRRRRTEVRPASQGPNNAMQGIAPAPFYPNPNFPSAQVAAPAPYAHANMFPMQNANQYMGPVAYMQPFGHGQGPVYPAPYVQMYQDAPRAHPLVDVRHHPVPQNSEEAIQLLQQLGPEQRESLARLFQALGKTPSVAAAAQIPTRQNTMDIIDDAMLSRQNTVETIDHAMLTRQNTVDVIDDSMAVDGKGKERAGASPPSPSPAEGGHGGSPNGHTDALSNQFAMLLLNAVHESQTQLTKLVSDLVATQNAAQDKLCKTMEHAVANVRSQADGLQNPLPTRGRRRTSDDTSSASADMPTSTGEASPKRAANRTRTDRGRTAQVPPEMEAQLVFLKACVRKHLKTMLKYKTWEELVRLYPPLTVEEIAGYRLDEGGITCSESEFRIDFIHDWKRFPFNMEARDIFIQNFLQCIKGGAFQIHKDVVPLITEAHVGDVLDAHIEYCRKKYRELYTPPKDGHATDSDSEGDTEKAKRDKALKLDAERKRKAMNSRKKTLFDSRWMVISEMGFNQHAALFDRLLPQNMSGDETDGPKRMHPMRYRIVESLWQSGPLKAFLRALDAMYREAWGKPKPGERATGGNAPRTRIERVGTRVEVGHPPKGLWRNCYDEEWVQGLKPYERRALKMINADYVFDLIQGDVLMHSESEDEVEEEL